jgi:hypothetical protein
MVQPVPALDPCLLIIGREIGAGVYKVLEEQSPREKFEQPARKLGCDESE